MDREAWQATVLGIQRVGHNCATKHSTAQHTEAHKMLDTRKKFSSTVTWNRLAY